MFAYALCLRRIYTQKTRLIILLERHIVKNIVTIIGIVIALAMTTRPVSIHAETTPSGAKASVGAYYFDGWAGQSRWANNPDQPWAPNAPTHLTRRMIEEFPEREPIWGWRDDSLPIMEQQIDLAADHGLEWFAFCWYWHDDGKTINRAAIESDPKHVGLNLFLKASNNSRLKFCLLVANHAGFNIKGEDQWKAAAEFWLPYFKHPRCLTVDGKPLIIIFNAAGAAKADLDILQLTAKQAGLPGVAVACCGNGTTEQGYRLKTHYNINMGYVDGSEEHHYSELVPLHHSVWAGSKTQPYIPVVTVGWDKRPWEGPTGLNQKAGWYFPDRTAEQTAGLLADAIQWMDRHPDQTTAERLVLLYAWNEFGEGGYLAPTKGDPAGSTLKAIQKVIRDDAK